MTTLLLYNVLTENNSLNKVLTNPITIHGSFRSELDSIDLIVEIETNNFNFNYVYIQSLSKYYFVNNIIHVNNRIVRLLLHCDVLMTYKNDILNSYALVVKGGNINPYYSTIESDNREVINRYNFNYTFNSNGNYVLVTIQNNALEGN